MLLSSDSKEVQLPYQYNILKFILNNKSHHELDQISSKFLSAFGKLKDIHKRTITLIFESMKTTAANESYCLRLLFVLYERIFVNNQLQQYKVYLFLSYPKMLLKNLDNIDEQHNLLQIRASHRLLPSPVLFADDFMISSNRSNSSNSHVSKRLQRL